MPRNEGIRVKSNNSTLKSALPANEKAALVSVQNHQVVTTSLQISEFFGKPHGDVLKSIRALECSELFRAGNFSLSCYSRKNGNVTKTYPMYYVAKDGFVFLAMGFTGKIAARFKEAYIEAFNEMERTLRENESAEYAKAILRERIAEFNKRMKEGVAEGRKRHGEYYGACGDMIPRLPFYEQMSFEENIKNELAWISCAYSDSMFFISQLAKKEEEVKRLRRLINKIREELSEEASGF